LIFFVVFKEIVFCSSKFVFTIGGLHSWNWGWFKSGCIYLVFFNETRVVKRKQNRNDIFINISLLVVDVSGLPAGDKW